jgi:hypothetical protein
MSFLTRSASRALLAMVLIFAVGARAAAQETEYDPEGRPLPRRAPAAAPAAVDEADTAPATATITPPPAPVPTAVPPAPGAPVASPPAPYGAAPVPAPRYPDAIGADDVGDDADFAPLVRVPPRITARLRALDRDYTALSARGSSGLVDGILSVVTGGLSIVLGALLPDTSNGFATYFYVFGAGNIAHGIVDIAVTPDPVEPALLFAHMPMRDVDEVKARLRFGEQSLESLAGRARIGRILEGSLDIATGVAFIPFYLGPRDYAFSGDVLDILMVTAALIRVVSGVATMLSPTDAERRWSAYDRLRDQLRRERRARPRQAPRVGAATLPGGGLLTLTGTL